MRPKGRESMGDVVVFKECVQKQVDALEQDVKLYCDDETQRWFKAINTIKLFNKRPYMIRQFRDEYVKAPKS